MNAFDTIRGYIENGDNALALAAITKLEKELNGGILFQSTETPCELKTKNDKNSPVVFPFNDDENLINKFPHWSFIHKHDAVGKDFGSFMEKAFPGNLQYGTESSSRYVIRETNEHFFFGFSNRFDFAHMSKMNPEVVPYTGRITEPGSCDDAVKVIDPPEPIRFRPSIIGVVLSDYPFWCYVLTSNIQENYNEIMSVKFPAHKNFGENCLGFPHAKEIKRYTSHVGTFPSGEYLFFGFTTRSDLNEMMTLFPEVEIFTSSFKNLMRT